jgi:transcriptional repressor NrdR
MRCPYCKFEQSRVVDTSHDSRGGVRRRRECENCGQRFSTYERPILATPMIVKQDGTREEFDREKLIRGIRIACAKRPVSATTRATGRRNRSHLAMGRAKSLSRCGDMVIVAWGLGVHLRAIVISLDNVYNRNDNSLVRCCPNMVGGKWVAPSGK